MIKISVRIDDVTDDMDWKAFGRLEAILDKYGICPLIGVIPDNMDNTIKGTKRADYKEWLARKISSGWVVAMHGYNHKYVTKKGGLFPLNLFSEYAGISYKEQYSKISRGLEKLKELEVNTSIFMAPAHSFDSNTIKALKQCGIKYITDGFGSSPFERDGITFLPIMFKRSSDVKRADGHMTLVLHAWTMKDKDFGEFEKLIIERRDQFENYAEVLKLAARRQGVLQRASEYLKAILKRILVKLRS